MDIAIVYMKSERRPDNMESLDAGSSGIDHQHIPFGVTHDLQYMRMTADENIRPIFLDQFQGTCIVPSGITADMGHQYLHTLALEETVEGVNEAKVVIVAITGNTYQRLETSNHFSEIHSTAEVPGVPDLVDRCKKFLETVVKDAVSIRHQSDIHLSFDCYSANIGNFEEFVPAASDGTSVMRLILKICISEKFRIFVPTDFTGNGTFLLKRY